MPGAVSTEQPISRLPAANRLDIVFALPLRNPQGLTNRLREIYQRGSPGYHHYLTPAEFTSAYGPAEEDYQAVINFAKAHHLTVTGTHPNRTLVNMNGAVGDIEQALHVHLNQYRHPTEKRVFFAPDTNPSLDLKTPVLSIGGLQNYSLPRPLAQPQPQGGSGGNGNFLGEDIRAAYLPGVSLTGTGQSVGLVEFGGYTNSDITNYALLDGITNPPALQNILIDGGSAAGGGEYAEEVSLDIEMAIGMAPGLSKVLVYIGNPYAGTVVDDLLNRMANDNKAAQLSSSYTFDINAATGQIFQQMAAQGQSFFQASGDSGSYAYLGVVDEPSDDPNITIVGGTALTTSGPLGSWVSETVWSYYGDGSGGGSSVVFPIPSWQQGVSMALNQGSTNFRNLPDVAMVGTGVVYVLNGAASSGQGTSFSTPLWAGFTALVNEQAALNGQAPVGFINPAIYDIGRGANYTNCFHDITTGANTNGNSPTKYFAVPGYDLCTGWGTPNGSNLIAALLAPQDALVIAPELGFTAVGPIGGPFGASSQSYRLTNAGTVPLGWSIINTSQWLTVSLTNGTLQPGGTAVPVTVSLNSTASNLLLGNFSGTILFSNGQDNVVQSWPFALLIGNGGFETGDFTDWVFAGSLGSNFVVEIDDSNGGSYPFADGISYAYFVHSGLCGAFLGQSGSLGSLTQTVPTGAGDVYLLSCWLRSIPNYAVTNITTPNEFRVQWNGATLFDQPNMGVFNWTNLQFVVEATGSATPLQFAFRDDPAALALDDITLQAVPPPVFQTVKQNAGVVTFSLQAMPELAYQLQYTTNLNTRSWSNLGPAIVATTNVVTASDVHPGSSSRFYRFIVLP